MDSAIRELMQLLTVSKKHDPQKIRNLTANLWPNHHQNVIKMLRKQSRMIDYERFWFDSLKPFPEMGPIAFGTDGYYVCETGLPSPFAISFHDARIVEATLQNSTLALKLNCSAGFTVWEDVRFDCCVLSFEDVGQFNCFCGSNKVETPNIDILKGCIAGDIFELPPIRFVEEHYGVHNEELNRLFKAEDVDNIAFEDFVSLVFTARQAILKDTNGKIIAEL